MSTLPRSLAKTLLLSALTLLASIDVFAQQRPIVKYTVREGLVQNQVISMLKDSRGYVWCGTWYGLSRFNGETFENYTEAEGLWNSHVNDVIEDSDGYIWVLGGGTRLAKFDGKVFRRYWIPANNTGSIIFNSKTKSIQVQLIGGPLLEVKGDTLLPAKLPNFPINEHQFTTYQASEDRYLISIENQVLSYRDGVLTKITDKGSWGGQVEIKGEVHLTENLPNGVVQIHTLKGNTLIPFLLLAKDTYTISKSLSYPYVFAHLDSLYYLPANSRKAENIGENPPLGYPADFLNQDISSTLWLGTERGLWGLVLNGFKNFEEKEVPNTWSVVEDHQGKLLFLNYWRGVQEYDHGKLREIPQSDYYPKALQAYKPLGMVPGKDDWYFDAFRDQNGYCWIPVGGGLFRYRGGTWNFIRKGSDNLAFNIVEDVARRKILVASSKHFYTVDTDPPFRTDSIKGKSKLYEGIVFCAAVSPNGEYWIAGRGVDRYDPDKKTFVSYTIENGKLPIKGFYVLYFDWNGDLWAGGPETVCRYNLRKDCFEKMFDRKFHQRVQFLEQIDSTHLMIGDMRNLYVLDLKKFNATRQVNIKTFNHHNGFMGMEPGQLGSYRDSKGNIWITSSSVLSVLDPRQMNLSILPPRLFVATVNKRGVSFVHPEELVVLEEGESIVNVKMDLLGDDKPYNSQFSYWLDGVTEGWTDWQEQPVITLNNLSNGIHTLKVRSRSGDFNVHEASIATLRFRTKVAIWKSPDFYLYVIIGALALLTALAVLGAVSQRRRRKVIQQQAELLEQQVELDGKERGQRLLQAQTIQSQLNTHFTANTLTVIQRQINHHEAERATKNLIDFARLARAYLEDSLLQDGGPILKAKDITLHREVSNLKMYIDLMQLQYENRHIEVDFQVAEALDSTRIELPPFLIQPYVENAFVHGLHDRLEGGMLRVEFRDDDGALLCHIEDNGAGHESTRKTPRRTSPAHQSVSTGLSEQRTALLNELGYDIRITTTDRQPGTLVTVRVGQKAI